MNPNYPDWIARLQRTVKVRRLVERAQAVRHTDIWCSADRFDLTAQFLAQDARSLGLSDAEVVTGTPGRGPGSGEWTQWERWTARGATLTDASSGELIADYARCPYHLAFLSARTPAEGITAPLVVCDQLQDLTPQRVRGKLVLSSQACRWLRPPAVEAGALGLVVDVGTEASEEDVSWQKLGFGCWPPGGRTFAFSISRAAGKRLRERLAAGQEVRLTARVDTLTEPGGVPWVTTRLPGVDPEAGEVLVQAHDFEPGLIDNASGVAAIWEAAAAIREAVLSGALPRPKRSLRLLSMYESFGMADFMRQRADLLPNLVADVNVDCLGAAGAKMLMTRQPAYLPNALEGETDPFCAAAAKSSLVPWETWPFHYGDDRFLADPIFGVPTVYFCVPTEYDGYHNSRDDGRHLDEAAFADQTVHIAAYLYRLLQMEFSARPPVPEFAPVPGCSDQRIPRRTFPGAPMLENLPNLELRRRILELKISSHALMWANGRKSVAQIAAALASENHAPPSENLSAYFEVLESIGYCRLM